MKELHGHWFHTKVQEAVEILNLNFSTLDETLEEHKQCIKSLNSIVEQQQKEIDSLKEEQQVHFDAFAHHRVAIDNLQSEISVLRKQLLETIKTMDTFVCAVKVRLDDLDKAATQVSQFYKNKSEEWK